MDDSDDGVIHEPSQQADDSLTLNQLRADILREKQMIEMLSQSHKELEITVNQLNKQFGNIDDESNEWKTRYETQTELNEQLLRQIFIYSGKIDELKSNGKSSKVYSNFRDKEVTPHDIKRLERELASLIKQVRDLEWRIDQESKAYHKANEERKLYQMELNAAKEALNDLKIKQLKQTSHPQTNGTTPRKLGNNIPEDQRILDPRKGPIKKIAAVKSLPRLEKEDY